MTMREIDDEMLMAAADGELPDEERARIEALAAADPAVAARLAAFRASAAAARAAFAGVLAEPVPERLVAAARTAARAPRPRMAPLRWLMAASIVLVAGIGGYLAARLAAPPEIGPRQLAVAMARGLATAPSGAPLGIAGYEARVVATYATDIGYCRQLLATGDGAELAAVACARGEDWTVPLLLTGDAVYRPAADASAAAVDGFLDAVAAGTALTASEENAAIARGWAP